MTMTSHKYLRKEIEVEACQFDDENVLEMIKFGLRDDFYHITFFTDEDGEPRLNLKYVPDMYADKQLKLGDAVVWINGRMEFCSKEIFEAEYAGQVEVAASA